MDNPLTFNDILEAVDVLPLETQEELVTVLKNRLRERARESLIEDVEAARAEYENGQGKSGTVDEIMREITS